MGTNYYRIKNPPPPCETCKRTYQRESLHIGKQSCGWVFSLHVYPNPDGGWQMASEYGDDGDNPLRLHPKGLEDWAKLLLDDQYEVIDEYGKKLEGKTVLGWLRAKPEPPQQHHTMDDRSHYGGDNYDLLIGNFT